MTGRRRFALGLAALAATARAAAQPTARVWRLGFLSARRKPASLDTDYYGAFPRRMRALGYVEGKNLAIEWRFAEGDYDRLAGMAGELSRAKVDAMLALGMPGALAAQRATTSIPVVFVVSADPVQAKLVHSLARPGTNLTGICNLSADLAPKQLELLSSLVPGTKRIAILVNPGNTAHPDIVASLERRAAAVGLTIATVPAPAPASLDAAVATARQERAGALIVALDPMFIQEQTAIAQAAVRQKLPAMFSNSEAPDTGGLMSYGQNQSEIYIRAADYVDRIFKGARPAEMPVEQPTRLELVVNLKTARAIGLKPPASLIGAADRLID